MGEPDFHSLKRRELQALCKQHNIRANSTNLEMANNLTQLFKEKENQIIETVEVSTEAESSNVLVSKKIKKVRFSPENELIEFTRSHKLKRSRRSVVLTKTSNLSVDNVNCAQELNGDCVDRPIGMRLRGKTVIENVDIVSKRGIKKVIIDDKSENQGSVGKIEDKPVGMQLRRKTLKESVDNVTKGGRKRVIVDNIENQDGVGNDENEVGNRRPLRNKGVVSDGNLLIGMEVKNNGKGKGEALVEPQDLVRRSKRRVSTVSSSKMVVESTKVGGFVTARSEVETGVQNHENVKVELRRSRRKSVLPSREQRNLEPEPSSEKVDMPGKVDRTSRRKNLDLSPVSNMIETKEQFVKPCVMVEKNIRSKRHASDSLEVSDEFGEDVIIQRKNEEVIKSGRVVRKSVLPSLEPLENLETKPRNEKVIKPGGVVRTLRRQKLDLNPVSSMIEMKEQFVKPCAVAQKNTGRSKRNASHSVGVSDEFGGDDIIQRKNETRKKEKVNVFKEVVIDDSSHNTQSTLGVSDVKKPSSTMKESTFLEGSPQDGVTEHREPLAAQLSVPEVTGGPNQKLLSESTETTKLNREIQDNSIVNSIALTDMDENGPSRMKDVHCEKDFPEMVVEKAHLTSEADVHLLNEENIIVADNDDAAAQTTSHTEISTFHANCEEVTENSNVCVNEESTKNSLLAGAFTFDDQTDLKSDLAGIEAEAEECNGPKADIPNLVSEHNGVCAQENPGPVKPEFINDVSLPLGCEHSTDMELLVASSPCHGKDTEKAHNFTSMRFSEIENTQTEYDLNDVNCLKESNVSPYQSNEDTAERSGSPKNSSGYDTLADQCQSDKDGVAEISEETLIPSNILGDNMSMEKTIMGGEHEATKQAEEISNDYTSTLADNWNCSKENEDDIEAVNADVGSFCDTVITELELGRRLGEGKYPDIIVAEIQYGQIGKEDNITLNGPNEDSCQGTKMSNLETYMNKSTVTGGVCSSIQKEELNMDVEKESQCVNTIKTCSLSEQEVKFEASSVVDEASGSESILRSKICDEDICSVKDNIVIVNKELPKDRVKDNECEKSLNESSVSEREASGSESILKPTSSKEDVCTVKENVVIETISSDRIERGRGMEFEKVITESLIFEATDHEAVDTGCMLGTDETDLRLLFATPIKTEASYKVDEFCRSESKLEESCLEKVCSAKQKASHDKVGEPAYHDDTACIAVNDESDLQLLFTTPNKSFSCEANKIHGVVCKHALEECTAEKVCSMKQNASHEEVGVAGFELANSLSPEAPSAEALVDADLLDNLACATVSCGEEMAQSSENFDTGSQNQIQVSVATLSDNLNCSREKEKSVDERTADVELCIDDAIEKLEVTSLSEWKFHDTVVTETQDQESGQNRHDTDHEVIDARCIEGADEADLRLLFATPNKTDAFYKIDECCRSESKLEESCLEKVCSAKQNASHDKVGEAGYHDDTECIARNVESDLQLLFTTPNKSFSCEANKIHGVVCKHALEECTVEKICPMKQNTSYEESEVAGFELTNSLSPEPPNTKALVDADFLDNLACATVSCGEELAPSSENFDTGSQNQSQDSVAILSDNLNHSREKEELVDERTADVELCIDDATEKLEVTSLSEGKFHDTVVTEIQDQDLLGCNIMTNVGRKLSEEESGQNRQDSDHEVFDAICIEGAYESDLQLLFTTPNKSFSCEANKIHGSESKHALEECTVERVCPMKQNASHEEVGVAGFELTNSLSPEVPNTEALVHTDFLDNLTCATESCVNCGEELVQSSENFDTGPQNQIQVSIATLSDNLNCSREKEESVDERTADVELCTDDANEKLEVTSLSEGKINDTLVTEFQDQVLLGCNITTNVGGKLSEEELGQNRQESELLLLFSTPNKSEASCEANETRRSETKLQESCVEKASCDKVYDAISDYEVLSSDCIAEQYEVDLQLPFATPSKIEAFRASECKLEESCMEKEVPNNEALNLVSGLELENLDNSTVLPVIFEASKENWTGETYEENEGTSSLSVEHILSSGQTCLYEEPKDDDQDSAEIISTMASPPKTRNENCDEKLLDIESAENLKLAQSSELRSGFSQGSNIKRVTSTDAFHEPSNSMLVSSDKFQNEIDSRFEILKQSDVMETIPEYTNYESSNSIDIDRSGVTLPIKATAEASNISCSVDELHEASILDEVSAIRRVSTAKKTARTILIHGTPNKALVMADMKENDPLKKKPLIGDITITRPAKRRALQDIEYK